ncbi:ABC transporter permease [Bifidobacterium bombi]|uniref:Transport permease protein n=1 Tax=Bifidobacterium bombi DSM 19703 TaxID=1341695 RepID=A0A086BPJ3_9BIFI|nr:ABC transporter permease [Bifidobacterium bombi]KFF31857.1 polysaccharide ABC transporter, permease protein [Bifidobacterium bombi DSM 19703]
MKQLWEKLSARYRYSWILLKELVKTDFKLRYEGSWLGVAWSVIKPLMLFAVMYVVFVRFLRVSDGSPTWPIVLLCGISLWNFFNEATTMGMQSVVSRGDLLRKINFPKYITVVAATIGSLISLAINMAVVIIFGFFSHAHYTWRIIFLPLNFAELYLMALGMALILATLFVWFRDLQHLWEVFMQVAFYATPIIYPLTMVTQMNPSNPKVGMTVQKLMLLSPPAQAIMDIRHNLLSPENVPTVWGSIHTWYIKIIPVILTAVIFLFGVYVFRKNSAKFAEVL